MLGSYNIYDEDITIVKDFGSTKLKVISISKYRKPGFELDSPFSKKKVSAKNTVNEEKLDCNISRARSKVQELGFCNEWQYFVTLTLDSTKLDRYDLEGFHSAFSEFIHNYNRRRPFNKKVKYLLIPEMHKDGAWHMHGLLAGLCDDDLVVNKYGYLDWPAYAKRFGYISLGKLREKDKAVNYILKYINKDLQERTNDLGAHLYYRSRGLQQADVVYKGKADLLCPWDYEHPEGYCKIKTFDLLTEDYTEFLRLKE